MNSLQQRITDKEFSNWLDFAVGLSITRKGLTDYVKATMDDLHKTIKYGNCANLPLCFRNCSKTERCFSSWCQTCTAWKTQLILHNKFKPRVKFIKWNNINSSEWPVNINEVVKVFGPEWWQGHSHYTDDLSVVLSLIQNCKDFKISPVACKNVREDRNGLFAHGQLGVNETEKCLAFQKLMNLLEQPEVSTTSSCRTAIAELKCLNSTSAIDLVRTEHNTSTVVHLRDVLEPANYSNDREREILEQCLSDQVRELNSDTLLTEQIVQVTNYRNPWMVLLVCGLLIILSLIFMIPEKDLIWTRNREYNTGL